MAVRVVPPGGDQGEPGPDRAEQPRILERRAVVGHFEHIHRRQRRVFAQQPLLGRRFEIAEKQQRGTMGHPYEQGDAGVVRLVGAQGGPRARPQHPPGERPDPPLLPRPGTDHRHPCPGGRSPHERGLLRRLLRERGLDHADRPVPQDTGQPADMVGVEVGEQQQRNACDAEFPQTAVGRPGVGAGVHDHGRALARRQHDGVALPDVTHRERPARRRPAGDEPGDRRRSYDGEQQEHGAHGGRPRVARDPSYGEQDHDRQRDEQQRAPPAARPRDARTGQRRTAPGDGRDPARGPAGAPGQRLRHGHRERRQGQGGEAEHRRRSHRRLGEEIAGDRHQADPGREHRHHRRAHGLRRTRRGQRLRQPGRHPAPPQRVAPPRRDGEQRAGGQYGEEKAITARQPRVVEHQQQNGRGQRGNQRPAAARADGEKSDQPTGRGPQHTGLRTADDHEAEREHAAEERGPPQRDPQPWREPPPLGSYGQPGWPDQQCEHHRQIASGDGEQMREIGRLERVVQFGRHP